METHCYEIARRVSGLGHDVTVITRDDGFGEGGPLPSEEAMEGFTVVRAPSNRALTRRLSFDAPIYLNNFDMSLTFFLYTRALISRLRGARPKIWLVPHGGYTPYWDLFPKPKRMIKRIYHRTLGKFFINHLTCGVSALNGWEKDQLVDAGVHEELITIRTNGVEDIAYDLPVQSLEDHGLDHLSAESYVLMLCRVSREKNIGRAIEALAGTERSSLVIGGSVQDKEYYEELKALIAKKGLEGRVHFIGYVSGERKYALIDGAAAVVLISLYESDSIIVKEALARGTPVVASIVGPLPSMVSDGENGFLVEPENGASVISALSKALSLSPADRERIKGQNREKAMHYRWSAITVDLLKDIESCEG